MEIKIKNRLTCFRLDDEKLLEKYKAIWTKIEDLKTINLNVLSVHDNRYIQIEIIHMVIMFIPRTVV